MSTKIKLGQRPEFIEETVEFVMADGEKASLDCQFEYRTKKEFGKLWDEITESGTNAFSKPEGETMTYEEMFSKGGEIAAKNALKYLKAWPLDVELNAKNMEQLFDEQPAAQRAFWETYHKACVEGKRGN